MGDLTTFAFPGRTTTRGCQHMAVWLPLFSELCRLEGLVRSHLDVTQVAGDYEKSGGTHREGTAADVAQDAVRVSELAREAGAPASWPRGESFGQPSMRRHSHLALDCSCPSGADYQITAVKAGYNGLGTGGRGGRDYIRKPSAWRNYTTGVAWMRARIAQLQQEEDAMPLTQTDATLVARTVITELLSQSLGRSGPTVSVALQDGYWKTVLLERAAGEILATVKASTGVDLDETALAQQMAALVAPVVRDAVLELVAAGGSPEAIADAVFERIGGAFSTVPKEENA